ncbi:hypothetical protein FGO68_gene1318 [Halteria grandinella]|uniref:Uncharacterized protein n=1 Tax=Halteria grandinella TaxID=5974 RepID=A0A8J8NP34_HALGN|nr:hypothetical protein FGO68_gene1318 [Halteria grandinella]
MFNLLSKATLIRNITVWIQGNQTNQRYDLMAGNIASLGRLILDFQSANHEGYIPITNSTEQAPVLSKWREPWTIGSNGLSTRRYLTEPSGRIRRCHT